MHAPPAGPPPPVGLLAELVATLRSAFPALRFDRARLIERGEDHLALVLDEIWLFRFPRTAEYRRTLPRELRVLLALAAHSPVAVPRYQHVAPDGSCAGYRLIRGEELTPDRFAALTEPARRRIVGQASAFLSLLHALPLALVEPAEGDPPPARCSPAAHRHNYLSRRRAPLAPVLGPALLAALDRFYEAFVELAPPLARLIHGDFNSYHLLLAPERGELAGIIDFADAEAGDPAADVAFFWSYGERWLDQLLAGYQPPGDEGLRARSRAHHLRYLADQLYYATRSGTRAQVRAAAAVLAGELAAGDQARG